MKEDRLKSSRRVMNRFGFPRAPVFMVSALTCAVRATLVMVVITRLLHTHHVMLVVVMKRKLKEPDHTREDSSYVERMARS